jgi:uncharacterized protein YndB with AHSA1/START domain
MDLFDHWVRPELLVRWWPREAKVDPRVGGPYQFSWPEQNWHLRGTYTSFEPGRRLAFTWAWDHDVGKFSDLQVDLVFQEIEGGTRLTITHGPWGPESESQVERQGVIEGWIHFGMRLSGLRTGTAN